MRLDVSISLFSKKKKDDVSISTFLKKERKMYPFQSGWLSIFIVLIMR